MIKTHKIQHPSQDLSYPKMVSCIFRRKKEDELVMVRPASGESILSGDDTHPYHLTHANARIATYSDDKELRLAAVHALAATNSVLILLEITRYSYFQDARAEAANMLATADYPAYNYISSGRNHSWPHPNDIEILAAVACLSSMPGYRKKSALLIFDAESEEPAEIRAIGRALSSATFSMALRSAHFDSISIVADHYAGVGLLRLPLKFTLLAFFIIAYPFVALYDALTRSPPSACDSAYSE